MDKANNCKNSRVRNDVVFILALLLLALAGAVYLFFFRGKGNMVEVAINGEAYGVYSLNDEIEVDIFSGEGNAQVNRMIISGGKVYVENASCPDKICVNHRPIYRDGESIVCLPNGVVIEVSVSDTSDSPDIVV